jgi:hypothetical protein
MVQTISSIVINHVGSTHRRLANSGVKKSGGASVKNGELHPILARICSLFRPAENPPKFLRNNS